jgi:hypothetical protein
MFFVPYVMLIKMKIIGNRFPKSPHNITKTHANKKPPRSPLGNHQPTDNPLPRTKQRSNVADAPR